MAQKTASTVKSEVTPGKVSLQFGKANNFHVWRLFDRCSIEFGFQANALKNNVPFVPPAIVAADYTPLLAPGEAQLPVGNPENTPSTKRTIDEIRT
jgi:hypothetical protein